jgi:hypothetical protein
MIFIARNIKCGARRCQIQLYALQKNTSDIAVVLEPVRRKLLLIRGELHVFAGGDRFIEHFRSDNALVELARAAQVVCAISFNANETKY